MTFRVRWVRVKMVTVVSSRFAIAKTIGREAGSRGAELKASNGRAVAALLDPQLFVPNVVQLPQLVSVPL